MRFIQSKDFHPQPKSPAGWRKVADRGPVGILNGVISKHDSAEFITVESKSKHDLAERSAGVSRAHQHRVGAMPSALMSPPPWVLISPGGLPYLVRDSDDLKSLPLRTLDGLRSVN